MTCKKQRIVISKSFWKRISKMQLRKDPQIKSIRLYSLPPMQTKKKMMNKRMSKMLKKKKEKILIRMSMSRTLWVSRRTTTPSRS